MFLQLLWFHDNMEIVSSSSDDGQMTKLLVLRLAEAYLDRFEEELEQINIKNSIGGGKNKDRHRSRADAIRVIKETEGRELAESGFEMPDLLDAKNLDYFRNWNGELRYVQNIKLKKFTRQSLNQQEKEESSTTTMETG